MTETIFALATARGKAGIAVVRISGPRSLDAAARFGVRGLRPRNASLRKLCFGGDILDEGLVLYFPLGHSFTGEDVVEFQLHGSHATVSAVLRTLSDMDGLRPAEAGEFTRRALENGVLDLTQVEGLADLIDAETEAQRRQAQRVLSGAIGERAATWRKDLIRAAALIEATIDFADEDVPQDVTPEVGEIIDGLLAAFEKEIAGSHISERVREGFEVAIIGAPNAGKSSLLNALVGREAAITSAVAGTTRDVIEVRMDIGGLPVTLLDTAGLRDTQDEIERIGVERARGRAGRADLRVLVLEPGEKPDGYELLDGDIVVESKADLSGNESGISSMTGFGLDRLLSQVNDALSDRVQGGGVFVRERHRRALIEAVRSLESARKWIYGSGASIELAASDLRSALHQMQVLVGMVGVENLLDEIFSSFCIGK
jgi:tRNA modification GTPase